MKLQLVIQFIFIQSISYFKRERGKQHLNRSLIITNQRAQKYVHQKLCGFLGHMILYQLRKRQQMDSNT